MEYLSEECCPRQLYPLTLGPPTRHVQTCNKFVSRSISAARHILSQGYGDGMSLFTQATRQAGMATTLGESSWFSRSLLEGAAFKLEIPNLESQYG